MKIDRECGDAVSLLLFLETRAVDHDGRVNAIHMNTADLELAKEWNQSGFIRFGRIASHDVNQSGAHWVELSDEAWSESSALRMERGKRRWSKRQFETTEEKRSQSRSTARKCIARFTE